MTKILVDVWVPGRARPKGSLKIQGKRLVESNGDSKPWRGQMAHAFLVDYAQRQGVTDHFLKAGLPPRWTSPVYVHWRAFFALPPGCPLAAPSMANGPYATGDKDKLERNILDALQGARQGAPGVLHDDAQVIFAPGAVYWSDGTTPQGLHVLVTSPSDEEIRSAARIANIAMQAELASRGLMGSAGY